MAAYLVGGENVIALFLSLTLQDHSVIWVQHHIIDFKVASGLHGEVEACVSGGMNVSMVSSGVS